MKCFKVVFLTAFLLNYSKAGPFDFIKSAFTNTKKPTKTKRVSLLKNLFNSKPKSITKSY